MVVLEVRGNRCQCKAVYGQEHFEFAVNYVAECTTMYRHQFIE